MGNLVFLTSMGSPIGRYNIESDMRYITQQINDIFRTEALYSGGIPKNFEKIHPHALRHTFATRCFEKGMTPRTVQEIMGHADITTTMNVYNEATKEKKVASFANLEGKIRIS